MRKLLFHLVLWGLFASPLFVVFIYALAPGWNYPDVIPDKVDFQAWEYVAGQSGRIARHLASSVLFSMLTVCCTLVICILPAHYLSRAEFSGKTLVEGLLLAPALVPSMTFSMGVHYLFVVLGVADTMAGVVLVLTTFSYPFMLRALMAGFQTYGDEYSICAANLGAGFFTRLVRVELPLLIPSIVAGGSVVFLVAFSEYFLVFLIGGGVVPSYTGYLFPFLNSSERSVGALLTLLFLVVPLVLFFLVEVIVGRLYRRKGMY